MGERLAAGLRRVEERLRARGLTGAQAFEVLREGLLGRLGEAPASKEALDAVADLPLEGPTDLLGLAYERFFADLFKGARGQYFTPHPLAELLVERARVAPGEVVLDPTCGSGGLLICAGRRGASVRGIEVDPALAELARLNLRLARLPGEVERADFFRVEPAPVDVILANPPFSVPIRDRAVLDRFRLGRDRRQVPSDWLFCEALARWVVPGGRAAVVLPWSVLVNPSWAPVREALRADWRVEAVCGLPEGVFRPFGGAAGRAALLWMVRGEAGPTRWAMLRDPGYDVRSVRVRRTDTGELERLRDPGAWEELPEGRLTPPNGGEGPRLGTLARLRRERRKGPVALVELADACKETGELMRVQVGTVSSARPAVEPGDLLVSRLRPELGNVAVARRPAGIDAPLVGSPEWVVLEPLTTPHWLLHALRSPTWREALPLTGGQTRPRIRAQDVLDSAVPWPGEALANEVDRLSRALHSRRAWLRDAQDALQRAVDAWAAGQIDEEALSARIEALRARLQAPPSDDEGFPPG